MRKVNAGQRFRSRDGRQAGVAAVEMGIVLALLVMLLMGVWNFGRAIYAYDALAKGARSAVRYLSTVNIPPVGDSERDRLDEKVLALVACGDLTKNPYDEGNCPGIIPGIRNEDGSLNVSVTTTLTSGFNSGGTLPVALNLVRVDVGGFDFEFTIPFVPLGSITIGPVSATMAGL